MSITQFLEQGQKHQTGMIWDYVSASRLSLWSKCPLAFRKRYIDQEPTIPSPALFVGKVVHAVLAHVYRHRIVGHTCTVEEMPQFVADAWKLCLELEPCYFDDDAQEEKCRYQVLDLTKAYLDTVAIQEERPIAIEKRYEVPLITPMGEDIGIPLVGIVDLLLENEQGRIIVDFKTAASSTMCELQHELQLTAYAYLYRSIAEEDELCTEIRQLTKTKVPKINVYRFPTRTDDHFNRFFDIVREYLDALDRGVFNYRPGFQCSMCEHNYSCC